MFKRRKPTPDPDALAKALVQREIALAQMRRAVGAVAVVTGVLAAGFAGALLTHNSGGD